MATKGKKLQLATNFVGEVTDEGGVILTDCGCNHRAYYGAISAGTDVYRADAPDNPEELKESDLRFCDALGSGSLSSGVGPVTYSRASKSLGYRTQTGYPPNPEEEAKRPEAVSGAVLSVNMLAKPVEQNPSNNPFYFIVGEEEDPNAVYLYLDNKITEWYGIYDLDASGLRCGVFNIHLTNNAHNNTTYGNVAGDYTTTISFLNEEGETVASYSKRTNGSNREGITITGIVPQNTKQMRIQITNHMHVDMYVDGGVSFYLYPAENVGQGAVAIGADTAALENHSFSGGYKSISRKHCSYTFGRENESTQVNAIAMGQGLRATGENQAVFGQYNALNASLRFIVGVGTGDDDRRNALEIAKETGNARFYGTLRADGAFYCASTITNPSFEVGTDGRIRAGSGTVAGNKYTTALGLGTEVSAQGGLVCGTYNAKNAQFLFAVGNGTSNTNRSNLFQVSKYNGGQTKVTGSFSVNDKFVVDKNGKTTISGGLAFTSIDDASAALVRNVITGTTTPSNITGAFTGQLYVKLENQGMDAVRVYMWVEAYSGYSAWHKIYEWEVGVNDENVIYPNQ